MLHRRLSGRCYTDGSKLTDGSTGAGVVTWDGESCTRFNVHLGKTSTVFQGELVAIAIAAEQLLAKGTNGRKIIFLVDSQAAMLALGKDRTESQTVRSSARALNLLGEGNAVILQWVPGHMGVQGNEDADCEAKKGARSAPFGPEPFLTIPYAELRGGIERCFLGKHKAAWWADDCFRQTKEAVGWAEPWLTKKILQSSRRAARLITQMLTGHCSLQRHRYISKLARDETCPKCLMEDETPNHHVGECAFYEVERVQTLGVRRTSIRDVLKDKNVGALSGYLKLTKRLEEFQE